MTIQQTYHLLQEALKNIYDTDEANNMVDSTLRVGLSEIGEYTIIEQKMIAPTISKDLKKNSIYVISLQKALIFYMI